MNMIFGSIAFIVFVGLILWFAGIIRRDGASQQKKKGEGKKNELFKKYAPLLYNRIIGSDALGVRKPGSWGNGSTSDTGVRVESDTKPVDKRDNNASKVSDG